MLTLVGQISFISPGAMPSTAQGFLLTLYSGINPGSRDHYGGLRNNLASPTYETSALPTGLSHWSHQIPLVVFPWWFFVNLPALEDYALKKF